MIDLDGVEWLTVADAAARLNIDPRLIYVWLHRYPDRIRTVRAGRRVAVNMPDLAHIERAWRTRTQTRRRVQLPPGTTPV